MGNGIRKQDATLLNRGVMDMVEDKEMDEEAEFFKRMLEGMVEFKKQRKNKDSKKHRPEISAAKIVDGKVEITLRLPIEFLKKYAGDWDKDGVAQR